MWDLLKEVLIRHGLVALVLFMMLFGLGYIIRVLWKKNQKLWKQLSEQGTIHEKMMAETEIAHAAEIREIQEQCAERINDLQEKRLAENVATTREAITFIETTKTSVEKIRAVMEMLTDVMTGRR